MEQSSSPAQLSLGRNFWQQWFLANSLGHAVGLGLPILVADLLGVQTYINYGVIAFLSFGVWVGLAQWIVLRQVLPVSGWWVAVTAFAPLLSFLLITPFLTISPLFILLLLAVYPVWLGLSQWRILRQTVQPAWGWILTSAIAIVLGMAVGGGIGVVSHIGLNRSGISTAIAGLCGGLMYSVLTWIGLRHLTRTAVVFPETQKPASLDVPPNTQTWKFQVFSILLLFAILFVWSFVFPLTPPAFRNSHDFLWVGIYLFVYTYVSILIHELGHLVFALCNGFDLKSFAVDRFVVVRRGQGWTLVRTRRRFAGGFVLPVPRSPESLNRRIFMMILGGPVASFLLFCAGLIPLLVPGLVNANPIVWFMVFFSAYNLYLAIYNAIPLRVGYLSTDGRRLLDLVQNNLQGQRFLGLYAFNASLRQGIRPRDIDPVILDQVLLIPEQSTDHISGLLMAYFAALDQGDFQQAGTYLDRALEINSYYPEIFRGALLVEGVYLEAHIRHRLDRARQWFDQIHDQAMIEPYALLRAEAALLLAEGDRDAALVKVDQGLASAERDRFMVGGAIAAQDWLQALRQAIISGN